MINSFMAKHGDLQFAGLGVAMTQPITDYIATALSIVLFIAAYKKYIINSYKTAGLPCICSLLNSKLTYT